jgi:hypothetical protein
MKNALQPFWDRENPPPAITARNPPSGLLTGTAFPSAALADFAPVRKGPPAEHVGQIQTIIFQQLTPHLLRFTLSRFFDTIKTIGYAPQRAE